jgi:hypothetical protein
MNAIWLLPITALAVFLKAFQQLNVMRNNKLMVPPISFGMAFTEVFIIAAVIDVGASYSTVFWMGAGGAIGCLIAMQIHPKR